MLDDLNFFFADVGMESCKGDSFIKEGFSNGRIKVTYVEFDELSYVLVGKVLKPVNYCCSIPPLIEMC